MTWSEVQYDPEVIFIDEQRVSQPRAAGIARHIGLAQAVRLTLACGKGYRIPEPTRQADLLAEQTKRETKRETK